MLSSSSLVVAERWLPGTEYPPSFKGFVRHGWLYDSINVLSDPEVFGLTDRGLNSQTSLGASSDVVPMRQTAAALGFASIASATDELPFPLHLERADPFVSFPKPVFVVGLVDPREGVR